MRVATYLRVSTEEQNLENQRIKLTRFIEMKGWNHVKDYQDIISGIKDKRPGLDMLRRDARYRKFDVVLSVKLDRLGRSIKELLFLVAELEHFGIDIAFTDQAIDTTTPTGKLTFTILGAVAEFERDLISERTKAGVERARIEGKRIGRPKLKISRSQRVQILQYNIDGQSIKCISKGLKISEWAVRKTLAHFDDRIQHKSRSIIDGRIRDVKHTEE